MRRRLPGFRRNPEAAAAGHLHACSDPGYRTVPGAGPGAADGYRALSGWAKLDLELVVELELGIWRTAPAAAAAHGVGTRVGTRVGARDDEFEVEFKAATNHQPPHPPSVLDETVNGVAMERLTAVEESELDQAE